MIGFVIVPVLFFAFIQLLMNIGWAFLVKEDFMRTYKILALIFFICIALSFPVIGFYNAMSAMNAEAINTSAFVFEGYSIAFWIVNIIAMIVTQLVFNNFLLSKIVLRNKSI